MKTEIESISRVAAAIFNDEWCSPGLWTSECPSRLREHQREINRQQKIFTLPSANPSFRFGNHHLEFLPSLSLASYMLCAEIA